MMVEIAGCRFKLTSVLRTGIVAGLLLGVYFLFAHLTLAQEPTSRFTSDYVPGEVLVKFQPHVNAQDARRSLQSERLKAVEISPHSGVVRLQVKPGQEQQVINKLRGRGDVEFAELNYIAYALDSPNDPWFSSQWGLTKIDMPSAWDITTGNSSIIVAIVDTGIDLDHADFVCTVGGESKLTSGWNFVANNNNPNDDNSHGSHVAGIAAACTNNSTGVAGVAPNVRLMPIKVLDSGGGGTYEDVADGIIYAVDQGADIINLSLGGRNDSSTLANAVQYAYDNGVLVAAAAGNCAQYVSAPPCNGVINPIIYPAAYSGAMAVAATDSGDNWATFSEHHSYVEIAAPGSNIDSTVPGGYGSKSGTSMSTPHVAGLAALIRAIDPTLSHDEVRQIIQDNAVDLGTSGWDQYFGHGRIDAGQTLQSLLAVTLQTSPADIGFLADDDSGSLSWDIQIEVESTEEITWTAAISPSVSWLNIASSASGTISAATSPTNVTLLASTSAITYSDTPTITTVLITGTTASGVNIGPTTTQVRLTYVPELFEYRFPIIFKN